MISFCFMNGEYFAASAEPPPRTHSHPHFFPWERCFLRCTVPEGPGGLRGSQRRWWGQVRVPLGPPEAVKRWASGKGQCRERTGKISVYISWDGYWLSEADSTIVSWKDLFSRICVLCPRHNWVLCGCPHGILRIYTWPPTLLHLSRKWARSDWTRWSSSVAQWPPARSQSHKVPPPMHFLRHLPGSSSRNMSWTSPVLWVFTYFWISAGQVEARLHLTVLVRGSAAFDLRLQKDGGRACLSGISKGAERSQHCSKWQVQILTLHLLLGCWASERTFLSFIQELAVPISWGYLKP